MLNKIMLIMLIFITLMVAKTLLPNKIEGFNYNSCRAKGFSKEFCVTTPTGAMGVGTCLCDDGSIGMQLPGFYGDCVCKYP